MKSKLLSAILVTFISSNSTFAEEATNGSTYAFCQDRPDEPEILQNIDMRDAHKRILAQRMYTASALQVVADTGDCSCANRFPPWEATVEEYLERYAGIEDRWEILEATSSYRRSANQLRKTIRATCIEQGNW